MSSCLASVAILSALVVVLVAVVLVVVQAGS